MPIENWPGSQGNYSWPAKQKEKGLCDNQMKRKKKEYLQEIQEKRQMSKIARGSSQELLKIQIAV